MIDVVWQLASGCENLVTMTNRSWLYMLVFSGSLLGFLAYAWWERAHNAALDPFRAESAINRETTTAIEPLREFSGSRRVITTTVTDTHATSTENSEAGPAKGEPIGFTDLSSLVAGEQFAFHIPQEDSEFGGEVENVNVSGSGNTIIVGWLRDAEQSHRFIFTVGQHQTFGTLQTNKDRYQFESRDGIGRIVAVSTIKQGLDYSQPDFVVPARKSEVEMDQKRHQVLPSEYVGSQGG
jgi:hypothetical protein